MEHRPVEARDRASGRNLSEVHALNTLVNSSPRILLNEDIHHLELDRLSFAGGVPTNWFGPLLVGV
ncbi:hypothetical protein [Klebsiella pneumoniae]|uniref:hypothetical protein n=1 Tax=Klebsiella pneumoniae TaxID=573 RepID=UPI00294937A9|nr:hypothetical protein [Klebsiella pneumoniae]MDV5727857.1 hypothetical protein [Klebsiella pneumoniae]